MGLMDVLNGMMNGPRGQRQPEPAGKSSGGMSPIMIALLGLLAYKAFKGSGSSSTPASSAAPANTPDTSSGPFGDILGQVLGGRTASNVGTNPGSGGIDDILSQVLGGKPATGAGASTGGLGDILGSVFGGAAGGSVLSDGLSNIVKDLQSTGSGRAAHSWVTNGPNENIDPEDLAKAIGADEIAALSAQTGLPQDELLHQLAQELPEVVNRLTPEGRLPTGQEAERWV